MKFTATLSLKRRGLGAIDPEKIDEDSPERAN
jgi:hypothetical protein